MHRTIYFIAGQNTIDLNLLANDVQTVTGALQHLEKAQQAYILETGKNKKGEVTITQGKDIGILIVPDLSGTPNVEPISLPDSLLGSV